MELKELIAQLQQAAGRDIIEMKIKYMANQTTNRKYITGSEKNIEELETYISRSGNNFRQTRLE